ncbi:MAG TPA: TolC family protein, partial [Chryseolinea sp.]
MKTNIITAVLFSIFVANAFGQDSAVAKLSFKEAVRIGLQHNVVLNQNKNQLAYTQINKTSSLLQLTPSIDANANFYRQDGNSFNQQEGRVVNGKVDFVNGSIDASLPIFNGMNVVNTYRQAHNN